MNTWKVCGIAVTVGAGFVGQLGAQPAVPTAPAAPAQPTTLWSFLGLTKENHNECKKAFCESALGQMFSNMTKPATKFTGGIVPSCCPEQGDLSNLTKEEMERLSGVEQAAAKIQEYEASAKARRAAVRYLGTVDCHWWKDDVEKALIDALRTDRNECVRWEAAMALSRGCCCTKKVIETLAIVVSQGDDDNNVRENSPRVIAAARIALEHCLACQEPEIKKPQKQKIEDVPTDRPADLPKDGQTNAAEEEPQDGVKLTAFEMRLKKKSMAEVVQNAEAVLEKANRQSSALLATGRQGLLDIASASLSVTTYPADASGMVYPGDPTNPSPSLVERVKMVMPDAFPNEANRSRQARTMQSTSTVATGSAPAPTGGLLDRMARALMPYAMQDTRPVLASDVYAKSDARQPVVVATMPSWREPRPMPMAPVTPGPREAAPMPPAAAEAKPLQPSTTSYLPKPTEVVQPAIEPRPAAEVPPSTRGTVVQTNAPAERTVTVTVKTSADRLVQYLQDDTYSRLRDFAIDGFKPTDEESRMKALPAILKAAREDSSAKVRAACARCLNRMGMSTPDVVATLEAMKNDPDANVRREAILTLTRLQLAAKGPTASAHEPIKLPGRVP